jgi:AraC family transcriptional regulator
MKSDMERRALDFEERLDRVVEGFVRNASRRPTGMEIAGKASYSVAQTHRIFRKAYGESPGAFQRRLVLERAAEMLRREDKPVWQVALESGFASPEAFARAFKRAYRSAPSGLLQTGEAPLWLPAPSRVHYWRGSLLRSMEPGGKRMNIIDRLVEHDLSDSRRLIDRAQTLDDDQLDASLPDPQPRLFLECFEPTLRGRLDYLILTKEVWLAAVFARPNPMEPGQARGQDRSTAGLAKRWATVESEWRDLVRSVESEGRWDEVFIDALCDTPETFSFGGMIADVIDQSARQRAEIFRAFTALGHSDVCDGDPLTWERKAS